MRQAAFLSFAAVIATTGVFSANISAAQQQAHFEAAAIKPGDQNHIGSLIQSGPPGGQYHIVNMPLKQWVEMGLSVQDYALKAPSWLDTSRFDLTARLPNQPVNQTAMAEMMKTLLIERFGLKWHEEQQTVSGYELVVDKKVLMQPASLLERLHGSAWGAGPTNVSGTDLPMSKLAELLGTALSRPVVDATHLSGDYDLKVQWRPDSEAKAAEEKRYGIDVDNLPDSVFTAVREQLGLRLQPAKVPSKVIVVDHINSQPSQN